jgi:SAM-dependent methyltransferase
LILQLILIARMTNGPAPFDKQEYWSQRFQQEETFEWLMPWSVLEPPLRTLNLLPLDPTARILNLGCGNSDLPLDLYRSGHHHVTSVDFVASVIDRMKERCERAIGWQPPAPTHGTDPAPVPTAECPLQFLEMDCLDMSRLPAQSFQLCIDKSTSDAISCGDDDEYTKLRTLCDQVARVIQPGGTWCVVSYSRFRQYEWTEGLGQGLWRTEQILEIKVEQNQDKEAEATGHVVYVPDVFQYLYVNRRL